MSTVKMLSLTFSLATAAENPAAKCLYSKPHGTHGNI